MFNKKTSDFKAFKVPTPEKGFKIGQFIKDRVNPTPGNVGICLSGGGSRAMAAGMGQLRVLKHLRNGHGNLLEQTKAMSTVSGGSWIGVPFLYLDEEVSDDDYLNEYVANPGDLVLGESPSPELGIGKILDKLPKGNPGSHIDSWFSLAELAVDAGLLFFLGVPANMLWQTAIARHLLRPYGLSPKGRTKKPASFFSYDENTLGELRELNKEHQGFDKIKACLYAKGEGRVERPFMICNTALFVEDVEGADGFRFLAPVQCTPFFVGVVGSPQGVDANHAHLGGGGISPFAFNSVLLGEDLGSVEVRQRRPFSILDIVGASSAAFAETLGNLISHKKTNELVARDPDLKSKYMGEGMSASQMELLKEAHEKCALAEDKDSLWLDEDVKSRGILDGIIEAFIPEYNYWPLDAEPNEGILPTQFADGGSLENTGLASLLSYSDIDKAIVFINTPEKLELKKGEAPSFAFDPNTGVLFSTVRVDVQLCSLFGFQPYDEDLSAYKLYKGDATDKSREFTYNRIFQPQGFLDCLKGLWEASVDGRTAPAIYKQELDLLENEWFGIVAPRKVTVVWNYLNPSSEWKKLLRDDVQHAVPKSFPNYSTMSTELDMTEINLLANYTAWCVGSDKFKEMFISLYEDGVS